ncbi:MAG: DNA-binding response regulator [Bacteroidales bacterium]|nr:DNA-binding response regulator [Bacteroidales bacterium]
MKEISCFIIDDDSRAMEMMEELLKKSAGFNPVGSETAPEKAISIILSRRPEVLFLDVEMPGITGLDLVARIRKNEYDPIVIFVTAYEKYAIEAIRKAAFDYILKPYSKDQLKEVLKRIRSHKRLKKVNENGNIDQLTQREKEVFELLRRCLTSEEISSKLNISAETVYTYRRRIIRKLDISSTREIPLKYPPGRSL